VNLRMRRPSVTGIVRSCRRIIEDAECRGRLAGSRRRAQAARSGRHGRRCSARSRRHLPHGRAGRQAGRRVLPEGLDQPRFPGAARPRPCRPGSLGVLGIQTQVGQPCADDAWMNCKDPDPLIPQLHRRDLNHPSVSRRARNRLTQSRGTAAFHWTRILPPLEDSNSMTHSSSVAGCGAISSTNAGLVGFC